ncbi:hypothetical protein [Gordonia polyisoprenivorans]|uniref:hypothetical protein n=1 Tax=Gordonia polyisoprenivorans TaxID=84595 RepID=UPI001054DA8B|nr:hypothetical protein [Gordonia polyisoprenivorans]
MIERRALVLEAVLTEVVLTVRQTLGQRAGADYTGDMTGTATARLVGHSMSFSDGSHHGSPPVVLGPRISHHDPSRKSTDDSLHFRPRHA